MNLVGNSRQAIEQLGRSGTIHVRTKKIGEQKMLLEVRDDGPGVPPAILARIFDPFSPRNPRARNGAGLAIVLSVVREHGGQVPLLESATRRRGIPDRIACGGRAQSRGDRRILPAGREKHAARKPAKGRTQERPAFARPAERAAASWWSRTSPPSRG